MPPDGIEFLQRHTREAASLQHASSPILKSSLLEAGLLHIKMSGAKEREVKETRERDPPVPDPMHDRTLQPHHARGHSSHGVRRVLLRGLPQL